ncbi:MAG: hypothetical protein KME35_13950 [Aphanocapsa sp. GSE-SYN-MK-11-07L]|jgi:hypothetical protein|nr:hypothetical protein [Aphanocapsa sp. GSE-SYN-MK-11-07L]
MTRTYSHLYSSLVHSLLDQIADKTTPPESYKADMLKIGQILGDALLSELEPSQSKVLLAATAEDADFLAQGILERLEAAIGSVAFACFWNYRTNLFDLDSLGSAPILKTYKEPIDQIDILIIVKSVISGACVVRTNLENLIQKIQPRKILIVAPVLYHKAEETLKQSFASSISDKFQFYYLAKDTEKSQNGDLVPGIGGRIYERLGFGGQTEKNKYVPEIVKKRRAKFLPA